MKLKLKESIVWIRLIITLIGFILAIIAESWSVDRYLYLSSTNKKIDTEFSIISISLVAMILLFIGSAISSVVQIYFMYVLKK